MDTNKLIVNRILQVREPGAKRLGFDRTSSISHLAGRIDF